MLGSPHFIEDCCIWSKEKLESMKTRQLLNHYRSTYSWGGYNWFPEDYQAKREYQKQIKAILSTREHIPNKLESKMIRKERIKKGV